MITLITGTPGAGKTAWVVNELVDLQIAEQRTLFVHGIRALKIPHIPVFCQSPLCDLCRSQHIPDNALYIDDWPEWHEPGALIVVDEVQRIWRPRNGGSIVPPSVSRLETHRHDGIDFWLISQGPHLFDNFIRLLVGRHVHLVAKWNGRSQYEWPECKQDVQSRGDAVQRPYKLPSRVYNLYKSAELHTKQDKRKPLSFYASIGAVALGFLLTIYLVNRVTTRFDKSQSDTASESLPLNTTPTPAALAAGGDGSTNQAAKNRTEFPDFTPEIEGLPESAPAYRELIKVTAAPILAGCVQSEEKGCKCYTNQATPYPTSETYCKEQIANKRFNPYIKSPAPMNIASAIPRHNDQEQQDIPSIPTLEPIFDE